MALVSVRDETALRLANQSQFALLVCSLIECFANRVKGRFCRWPLLPAIGVPMCNGARHPLIQMLFLFQIAHDGFECGSRAGWRSTAGQISPSVRTCHLLP